MPTWLSLVMLIFSAVSPALKSLALAELQALATAEAGNPVFAMLLAEAEKIIAAL